MTDDSPLINQPAIEATGRTKESSVRPNIEGTKNLSVFSRGPIIMRVGDVAVHKWLMTSDGRWFDFHRLSMGDSFGEVNLDSAQVGEVAVYPGVIYRPGTVILRELNKWAEAQRRFEQSMQSKFKGTNNARALNGQLVRGD